jgi:hypothetical protein
VITYKFSVTCVYFLGLFCRHYVQIRPNMFSMIVLETLCFILFVVSFRHCFFLVLVHKMDYIVLLVFPLDIGGCTMSFFMFHGLMVQYL